MSHTISVWFRIVYAGFPGGVISLGIIKPRDVVVPNRHIDKMLFVTFTHDELIVDAF